MPEISRFQGITIKMFAREHNPPHFHAYYGKHEAIFDIHSGNIIEGTFPPNKKILISAWVLLRKKELLKNWDGLTRGTGFYKIEPLR